MGDPKKELGEDDFDKFDAKKSEAMGVFSEGNIFFFYLPKYHPIYIDKFKTYTPCNEIGLNLSKLVYNCPNWR